MFSPATVILAVCVYVGLLFAIARLSEQRAKTGRNWANHPLAYSLGLGVYCTTWTYYGSVGKATNEGMLFLTIYLGPTLGMLFASRILKRLVRLKNTHHITSIADFISARYAKSIAVAAIVTMMLVVGIVPYVALQLKAVTGTFDLITRSPSAPSPLAGYISPIVVGLMIVFTVAFGIRRLDPTERHPGMMVSLAIESLVKLAAFLAVGGFVLVHVYGGPGGFATRLSEGLPKPLTFMGKADPSQLVTWCTYLVLATSAFAFLPRQFHVGVIENSDEKHVKTAMWLSPLYLFLMNIFVVPIALGGMLTAPKGVSGDQFVLALPMAAGQEALSLFVFLGGFSAAIGMIMVETTTMATMISNHLLLPVIESNKKLWFLRRHLLYCRWGAAALFILASYGFEVRVGKSYMLVNMGMLSFAAVLQFAPAVLGGLFWRGGNRVGATLGLTAGFVTWFYTLLLPTFVKSGWMDPSLLSHGPWGLGMLRPEALFGVAGLPALTHGVLFSTCFNVAGYVLGSVLFETSSEERRLATEFVAPRAHSIDVADTAATIDAAEKRRELEELLAAYHATSEAAELVERCFAAAGIGEKTHITVVELAELYREVERTLAGAIGAASAHAAMRKVRGMNDKDSKALAAMYAKILSRLNISPSELRRRIDYYQEREEALQRAHDELEQRVRQRTQELEHAHRALVDTAHRAGKAEIATNVLHNVGNVLNSVLVSTELGLEMIQQSRVVTLPKAVEMMMQHETDLGFLSTDEKGKQLPKYLGAVAQQLMNEREVLLTELRTLHRNIEHIKAIVRLQQSYAGVADLVEVISLPELLEDAVAINAVSLERHGITLKREFEDLPPAALQKHKVLQILVNLINNAKHALSNGHAAEPVLTLRLAKNGDSRLAIQVIDNGMGMTPEVMSRIFQHGFTTKKDGHGFGLHSGAVTAREMGGTLTAHSDGKGCGAVFTLELPFEAARGDISEPRVLRAS
jgi:Na+/proline symporter/signal transduction histidine kinase